MTAKPEQEEKKKPASQTEEQTKDEAKEAPSTKTQDDDDEEANRNASDKAWSWYDTRTQAPLSPGEEKSAGIRDTCDRTYLAKITSESSDMYSTSMSHLVDPGVFFLSCTS